MEEIGIRIDRRSDPDHTPRSNPEHFGLVRIEALASGTPVVAFSEGSAPEIIEDWCQWVPVP